MSAHTPPPAFFDVDAEPQARGDNAGQDAHTFIARPDYGAADGPITCDEHVRQVIDDAFLNIIWVGAIPPIPLLSAAFVAYVQTNMVRKICTIHGVRLRTRRALVFGAVGVGGLGAFLTQAAAQSLRLVPGVGILAGAPMQIAVNAGATYAVGRLVHMRLERDGDVGSARAGRDKAFVRAQYQEGLRRAQRRLQEIADHLSSPPKGADA